MSLVQSLLNRVFWWRCPPDTQQGAASDGLQEIIYRWEDPIRQFQNVIVWQQPIRSLSFVAAFNLLFWVIVAVGWQFYGLVFTGVTLVAMVDCARHFGLLESGRDSMAFVVSSVSPTTTSEKFRVLSASELHEYITALFGRTAALYQKIRQFRQQQPGLFCAALCAFFLVLSIFGQAVSGPTIVYLISMSILTLPALLVRYPSFLQYLPNLMETSDAEVDDYLPHASGETIKLLSMHESVDDLSSPNLATGDAALYPDLTAMPSHEHSMDYLLELDVDMPSPRQVDKDSEESDISETQELHFKTKHFKGGSSSSSSGDDLSKGLRFRGNNKAQRQSSSDSNESFELVSKDDL